MEQALRAIIKKIPKGHVFDSHFVINQLIKFHSDTYFTFFRHYNPADGIAGIVHGHIAQTIRQLDDLVVIVSDKAWSETIHGKGGRCACWKKIKSGK